MLKLYFAPGACSFVPHVGLEAIKAATGEDFEPVLVKLHRGEHKTSEYLALNFMGQVPVLVVDGAPLTQIIAICDYLDRHAPQVGLLPQESKARARAMSLLAWMNNTVHPTFTHVFMPEKLAESEAARNEIKVFNTALYRTYLERIAAEVARGDPFWLGKTLSFLDAYAVTLLRWGGIAGIDPDSLPTYKGYVERVAAEGPVATALARERVPLHMYKAA
jgi:glutathione S-transferase